MAVTWLVNLEVLRVHKSHITRQCGVLQYFIFIFNSNANSRVIVVLLRYNNIIEEEQPSK